MMGNKKAFVIGLAMALSVCQAAAAEEMEAGELIGQFHFEVAPPGSEGEATKNLPLSRVNQLKPGQRIILTDSAISDNVLPNKPDKNTLVTLFVVPDESCENQKLLVLDPKLVFKKKPNVDDEWTVEGEWEIPVEVCDVSMVGLVFSPDELSREKKDNKFVKAKNSVETALKNQKRLHIITQLADYADLEAETDALKIALADWEKFPNAHSLDVVLQEFADRYNVNLPQRDTKTPAHQQLAQLLRVVIPDLMVNKPPNPQPDNGTRQAASLSASLTGLLSGNWAPVVMGMAAIAKKLKNIFVKKLVFQPVVIQKEPVVIQKEYPSSIKLYSLTEHKPDRAVYLGALRIPSLERPGTAGTVEIDPNQHLPIGQKALLQLKKSTSQLHRARSWKLVRTVNKTSGCAENANILEIQVIQVSMDTLELDTTSTSNNESLQEGKYILKADWDWECLKTDTFRLHSVPGEETSVEISSKSQDELIAGRGPVRIELTAKDFQFVEKLELFGASDPRWQDVTVSPHFSWKHPSDSSIEQVPSTVATQLYFRLSAGDKPRDSYGKQQKLAFDLDTSKLSSGSYELRITQSGRIIRNIGLRIHPPDPEILNLPLKINSGEATQLTLKGTGLERICGISSDKASWVLDDNPNCNEEKRDPEVSPSDEQDLKQRKATVTLKIPSREEHPVKEGECLPLELKVQGLTRSVRSGCVEVVGPRPRILSVQRLLPLGAELGLHKYKDEIPAGVLVGFTIKVKHLNSPPTIELECSRSGRPFQAELTLIPGPRQEFGSLDLTGNDTLFLSLDPGRLSGPRLLPFREGHRPDAKIIGLLPLGPSDPTPTD